MKIEIGFLSEFWGSAETSGQALIYDGPQTEKVRNAVEVFRSSEAGKGLSTEKALQAMTELPQSYQWIRSAKYDVACNHLPLGVKGWASYVLLTTMLEAIGLDSAAVKPCACPVSVFRPLQAQVA